MHVNNCCIYRRVVKFTLNLVCDTEARSVRKSEGNEFRQFHYWSKTIKFSDDVTIGG